MQLKVFHKLTSLPVNVGLTAALVGGSLHSYAQNASSKASSESPQPIQERTAVLANPIRVQTDVDPTSIYVGVHYYRIQSSTVTIAGSGGSGGVLYRLSKSVSLTAGVKQSYSKISSFRSLYTGLEAGLVYSLSSQPRELSHLIFVDDKQVVAYKETSADGWHLGLGMTQLYLSTSAATVPFSGLNASTYYSLNAWWNLKLNLGAQVDFVSNPNLTLTPMTLFLRLVF